MEKWRAIKAQLSDRDVEECLRIQVERAGTLDRQHLLMPVGATQLQFERALREIQQEARHA